jgi:hypothetical protein
VSHGDDPSPGWAFLRKLIQIPVHVPHVSDLGVKRLVDAILGGERPVEPTPTPVAVPAAVSPAPLPERRPVTLARPRIPRPRPAPISEALPAPPTLTRPSVDIFTWRSTERHPEFHSFVVERLAAQPSRSVREAKRLLNVWQLYARILDSERPLREPADIIARAKNLLILAEIVTRWPAIQAGLHRRIDGDTGLRLLAEEAGDDCGWEQAVGRTGIDPHRAERALMNLRVLLMEHDGISVAELAAQLM